MGTDEEPHSFKYVIDHAIQDGKIRPLIIVLPAYNNTSLGDSGDYSLALKLTDQFHLLKGKYTPFRIWQTVLVVLVLLFMIGSMVSGVIISRSVLSFLPIHGGSSFGRKLHMLSAYWGFALMSLHLGLHWNMMLGAAGKAVKATSGVCICILRIAAAVAAVYGMYAFVKRDIGNYMLLKVHFVFFDYDEPLFFFLLDYIAVMGMFIFIGHYLAVFFRQHGRKKKA